MNLELLTWLHGQPSATGQIKTVAEDFQVVEDLGYTADNQGEQLLVRIRKTGLNTRFVADALGRFLKVPPRDISFAGMKDRHAVTEQTLCFRMPGNKMPDLTGFSLEGCEILEVVRHQRKIRTGGLAGNAFRLVVRNISDIEAVEQRLALIQAQGVPNYFGEQRFGRQGHNMTLVNQWAAGEITIRDRSKRSLLLSAARSAVFNAIVSARLSAQGALNHLLLGDAVQLAGRGSWFVANADEFESVKQRVADQELRITAALVGRGNLGPTDDALAFEQQQLAEYNAIYELLIKEKVDASRRAMLLVPQNMRWHWQETNNLVLEFWLPAGSFATSVIRELVQQGDAIEDITE